MTKIYLLTYDQGVTDDEDLLLFSFALDEEDGALYRRVSGDPIGPEVNIGNLSDAQCRGMFRFTLPEIREPREKLEVPEVMRAGNGLKWDGVDGLCIILLRLSYPCRLCDLVHNFGHPVCELSRIVNTKLFIFKRWNYLLMNLAQATWLTPQRIHRYAEATGSKGPLQNLWGFIDGTVRPICRPIELQRPFYNGHKRVHALKLQSIATPDGMIAHLYGPLEGKRHNSGMLRESGLLKQLENLPVRPKGSPYAGHGDAAYPFRLALRTPFKGEPLTQEQADFNPAMCSVRMSV